MKKIKVNNDTTTETTEAIGSIKMIQLKDSVSRSKRRLRTNSSSSSNNSTNSNSPSISSNNSIQKTATVLSRKHRDSALDLQSFMIKRINKRGDVVDKTLRASSASLISMLTVKDGDDDEEEGDPTVEDIMYNDTTEHDPVHNDEDKDDTDDDLDSVGEYNEDDEALSQCTSRSWSLFEKALELEKKVLESYENL